MTTVITGPTAPPVLPPGAGGANLIQSQNPDNPSGTGGVGLLAVANLGAGAQVGAGTSALGTRADLRTLVPGANVTLTQTAQTIEIAAAGGGGAPGGVADSVQTNNGGGGFTGDAALLYDGATLAVGVAGDGRELAATLTNAVGSLVARDESGVTNWVFLDTSAPPFGDLQIGSAGGLTSQVRGQWLLPANANAFRFTALGQNWLRLDTLAPGLEIALGNVADNPDVSILGSGAISLGTAGASLGVLGAAPVARATTGIAEAAFVENAGGAVVNVDSTFGGYTVQQIAEALVSYGLLT